MKMQDQCSVLFSLLSIVCFPLYLLNLISALSSDSCPRTQRPFVSNLFSCSATSMDKFIF